MYQLAVALQWIAVVLSATMIVFNLVLQLWLTNHPASDTKTRFSNFLDGELQKWVLVFLISLAVLCLI